MSNRSKDAKIESLKRDLDLAEEQVNLLLDEIKSLKAENERLRQAGEESEAAWLMLDDDYVLHCDPMLVAKCTRAKIERLQEMTDEGPE